MHTSLAPSCVLQCLTCCLQIPQRNVLFCGLVGVVCGARLGLYEMFGGDEFVVGQEYLDAILNSGGMLMGIDYIEYKV